MTHRFTDLLLWPYRPGNHRAPWFLILWRALWFPVIYGALAVAWFAALVAFGYGRARQFWRDAL